MCVYKLFRTFSNLGPLFLFIENLVELLVLVRSLRSSAGIRTGLSLTLFIFYRVIFFIVSRLSLISALASGSTLFIPAIVVITTVVPAVVAIPASIAVITPSVATSLAASATAATATPIVTRSLGILLVKLSMLGLAGIACLVSVNVEAILSKLLNLILVLSPATTPSPDLLCLLSLLLLFSLDLCDLLDEFAHVVGGTSGAITSYVIFFGFFIRSS